MGRSTVEGENPAPTATFGGSSCFAESSGCSVGSAALLQGGPSQQSERGRHFAISSAPPSRFSSFCFDGALLTPGCVVGLLSATPPGVAAANGNPVDCVVGDWTTTDVCDGTLPMRTWTGKLLTHVADGGEPCPPLTKQEQCKPVHCTMRSWSAWSPCMADGFKTRTRSVAISPLYAGRTCPDSVNKVKCSCDDCLVNEWGSWGSCNDGTGNKTRIRTVARNATGSGNSCPALSEQASCAVECVLDNQWSALSDCTKNAAGDWVQTKTRGVKTAAKNGGPCPAATDPTRFSSQACPNNGFCQQKYASLYEVCASTLSKCAAHQVGVDFNTGANIEWWKALNVWEYCDLCTSTLGCTAYTFRESVSNDGTFDCFTKQGPGTSKLENLADTFVSSTVVNTECKVVDNVPYGNAVECTSVPGFDTSRVYRAMCGQIRWYPNPPVADSCDSNWFGTRLGVNCTGTKIGSEVPSKLPL